MTDFRAYNSSTKQCSCLARYVAELVDPICKECDKTCLYCSEKLDASKCTRCNSASYRTADFVPGAIGTCSCLTGYYQTSSTVELCSACSIKCLTCAVTDTACTSCSSTNFRQTHPACGCMDGYF